MKLDSITLIIEDKRAFFLCASNDFSYSIVREGAVIQKQRMRYDYSGCMQETIILKHKNAD